MHNNIYIKLKNIYIAVLYILFPMFIAVKSVNIDHLQNSN